MLGFRFGRLAITFPPERAAPSDRVRWGSGIARRTAARRAHLRTLSLSVARSAHPCSTSRSRADGAAEAYTPGRRRPCSSRARTSTPCPGSLHRSTRSGGGYEAAHPRRRAVSHVLPATGDPRAVGSWPPIGLAGGLDLQAYATGDPVHLKNPLGSCRQQAKASDSTSSSGGISLHSFHGRPIPWKASWLHLDGRLPEATDLHPDVLPDLRSSR
jgi:hypothetical protein